jgi:hypothetical protein
MTNESACDRHLKYAAFVAIGSIMVALCSCGFSESTKQMLARETAARRLPVTRESLAAGTYKVLGSVTINTQPAPCRQEAVAYEALRRYGSKVDEIIEYDGWNSVGSGFYDACHGIAVQLIRKTPESSTDPYA